MQELIYAIDKDCSINDKAIAIKIQLARKIGFAYEPFEKQEILTQGKLLKASSAKDSQLVPFLIKEELNYLKTHFKKSSLDPNTPFNTVRIAFSQALEAFKLFSTTGKLFFHDKALIIDIYGKTEFFYKVTPNTVEGWIKTKSEEFNIDTCDYIGRGSPHWFIKGSSLKFIANDVSWKDLNPPFRPFQELIDEANEDQEVPRVIIATDFLAPKNEPLPLCILKDRLGSFADLHMVYTNDLKEPIAEIDFCDPRQKIEKEGKVICKRDMKVELGWEKDFLETGYTKKPLSTSQYYCPLDKVAKSIAFLIEIGWKVKDVKGNAIALLDSSNLTASSFKDEIVIKGTLKFDSFHADVTNVIGAFNKKDRFVEIAPGTLGLLPNTLKELQLEGLDGTYEIIESEIRVKSHQIGALAPFFENHPHLSLDKAVTSLKEKLTSFQGIEKTLPGTTFNGTLRPYQEDGLSWLYFLYQHGFHGILADDMGLGKTVQVIAFLSKIAEEAKNLGADKTILIVVPTSLMFNWKQEIAKFLKDATLTLHHGEKRAQTIDELIQPNFHIIITTYTTARIDAPLLKNIDFECLILDEAQAIKNAKSQVFNALCQFNSRFRLSITGTPLENHPIELWSHFRFLIPDLFGEEAAFQAEIQAGMSDPRYLQRIKKKIRPFMLRRRKDEVAKDLPEKIEQCLILTMYDEQREIYESFLSGIKKNLIAKVKADGSSKHRMEILESIMRLRQICCHPLLVHASESNDLPSTKLDTLLEDLKTALEEKKKVLVYSQFTSMLQIIAKKLNELHIPFAYLDGSTRNREEVVASFQKEEGLPIFLISLKAGGIGLNLTAADYVFLYDPWWNDAVENQAIDRAHRIGRHETVIAKRYILEDSIEQKMMKLKSMKSGLAKELLGGDDISISTLTIDDLMFLLT